MNLEPKQPTQSGACFVDTATLAARYKVCKRTIRNWRDQGLLDYFHIKHVTRFDLSKCDAKLKQFGYL